MEINHGCLNRHTNKHNAREKKGPSSYWMQDATPVFSRLNLKPGLSFLDLGCGPGDYSLHAARIIGQTGKVYALDQNTKWTKELSERADQVDLNNIKLVVADILQPLPLEVHSIDVCLAATVLHTFEDPAQIKSVFNNAATVLKPSGIFAVIECNPGEKHIGPPQHMRQAPESLITRAKSCGFTAGEKIDLGNNYMILFSNTNLD